VGNVVLNDVTTSGTISPASPTTGSQFNLTGYQTNVSIPQALAEAAQAIQPDLQGSATAQLDASGATPATMSEGPFNFDVTIPTPVPSSGVALALPPSPETAGPFTAGGGLITLEEDSSASLTLVVGGSPLSLTCTAYPNDDIPQSGITQSTPSGSPIDPIVAVATDPAAPTSGAGPNGGGSGGGSSSGISGSGSGSSGAAGSGAGASGAASGAAGTVDPSAVRSAAGDLAFTGTGSAVGWLGLSGTLLVVLGLGMLLVVDAPRRTMKKLASAAIYRAGWTSERRAGPASAVTGKSARLKSWFLGQ
jgi:hypothetical protein